MLAKTLFLSYSNVNKVFDMESSKAQPKHSAKNLPELITLQEASGILKCHPNTLRQWDKKGILKALRFGDRKDRRYKKSDIMKFIEDRGKT